MKNVIEFGDLTLEDQAPGNAFCDFNVWVNDRTLNFANVPIKYDLKMVHDYLDLPHGNVWYTDTELDFESPDNLMDYLKLEILNNDPVVLNENDIDFIAHEFTQHIRYYLMPEC